jgi:hypothetical protein
MRGLDAYLTREPPEPPEPLVCDDCGELLPEQAIEKRVESRYQWCDGKPHVIEGQFHDEAVLAIIGEEHRNEAFSTAYPALCGTKDGDKIMHSDASEIATSFVEEWEHEPYWTEDPHGHATIYVRRCSCGKRNEEVVI